MTIRSQDLKNGQPIGTIIDATYTPEVGALYAVAGIAALAFGLPLWCTGAWYTVKGWVFVINLILGAIGTPQRLALPSGAWVLIFIPVGLAYSFIEVRMRPMRRFYRGTWRAQGLALALLLMLLWVLLIGTDFVSTLLAVVTPPPGAWAIAHTIARRWDLAIAWTAVLTFLPEWLIMGGIALLALGMRGTHNRRREPRGRKTGHHGD